ncbi:MULTISPECIES: accessory Sec system protein Asp3 [Aerococcus]|uniref:Accessory Sec system protein Asp3 n=2 Tax=Aerococcus TaxID=1375 RepID=A0A2I1L7N1_9LACT|nr:MULTISPECIES: accessory Sec system protein Asp3 [Aerococcus]KAA9218566.1 accessory Sec system protein Asp3 [Aerococcus loyolae]KAA9264743.1 accessory Sec system protein Asp3 [Aerococcus loyolae]MCY3026101.1 accessory Sec system protein Asp3 [Aerococcus loyolae]MCY3029360.1 accessory Sec system protein Asp3 [Aerococcus loyolae]MDK6258203.1 accessory Sec system protein Asp3 [Aerococcus urinae]
MKDYYIVRWGLMNDEIFSHGSQIEWQSPDRVSFKNSMVHSGIVINQWSSEKSYGLYFSSPKLPLLTSHKTYFLKFIGQVEPNNSIMFTVEFFDYYGESLQKDFIRSCDDSFTVPDNYGNYTISLVHAGCRSITFKRLIISEILLDNVMSKDTLLIENNHDFNHLLFVEPGIGSIQEEVNKLQQIVLVKSHANLLASELLNAQLYLSKEAMSGVDSFVQSSHSKPFYFIGYGPISNLAAKYYAQRYPNSQALVTDDHLELFQYQKIAQQSSLDEGIIQWLQTSVGVSRPNIKCYYKNKQSDDRFIGAKLLDYHRNLLKLEGQVIS